MIDFGIVCVEGELCGAEIPLIPGESVIVGREPRFANLIFRDLSISRKHCRIELDEREEYWVTDYSECGIKTEDGMVFETAVRTKCRKGTVLQIGKAGTRIALG